MVAVVVAVVMSALRTFSAAAVAGGVSADAAAVADAAAFADSVGAATAADENGVVDAANADGGGLPPTARPNRSSAPRSNNLPSPPRMLPLQL